MELKIGTSEIANLRSGVRRPAEEYPRSKLGEGSGSRAGGDRAAGGQPVAWFLPK